MALSPSRVRIARLRINLPGGAPLLSEVNLEVAAGEVVVLVGGSGSGKSTISRALFEPERLTADGFELTFEALELDRDQLGLVPQRGALFDHLTVGGNLELARTARDPDRRSDRDEAPSVSTWLEAVSLHPDLAGSPPSTLSGGQAQRVAVARALAAGRDILFLDEPSVGLDPARVRQLARVVRDQVDERGVAAIVVTHDIALAAGVADRILFLDPAAGTLVPLLSKATDDGGNDSDIWPGPLEAAGTEEATRDRWMRILEAEIIERIDAAGEATRRHTLDPRSVRAVRSLRAGVRRFLRPFGVATSALLALPAQLATRPVDFAHVASRVVRQTLLRPLPFYAIAAALIGYTILFVISKVGGAGVRPDALVRQIGGSYVLALAPPLSAILFVAASGAASNAWLGSLTLTRQVTALEAIGVRPTRYLWAPAFLTLGLSYLVVAALFAAAMIAGGVVLAEQLGMKGAFELLTADFLDPRPERKAHLVRALLLFWIYAWGIASDVIAKGTAAKSDADAVTRSMTGSVVSCTLWVVGWELVTALWVFR